MAVDTEVYHVFVKVVEIAQRHLDVLTASELYVIATALQKIADIKERMEKEVPDGS